METPEEIDDSSTLEWGKKKKARKPIPRIVEGSSKIPEQSEDEDVTVYTYEEMLRLIYDKLKDAPLKTISIPAPKLAKVGGVRIRITNFANIMEAIQRDKEHASCFINSELGVFSSLTADGALMMKGNFTTPQIESVIKKYIVTYVVCKACQCYHTHLQRDSKSRSLLLVCELCQATSVPPSIKAGVALAKKS